MGPSFSQLPLLVCLPSSISSWQRAILKKKKNLYLLFTLGFWFYSVSQRAQTNTFKPRCLLLGFSLCVVQSYPVPQSINPHQTIFYTGVSYLSCILHALRQAFSFWYILSLPKMSHPENFWVVLISGQLPVNCPGIKYTQKFHHAGAVWQLGISVDERSRVVFHQTAGDRKREQKML